MKPFDEWNTLKKELHNRGDGPRVKQREIWWCSLGVNIGSEIDGKNGSQERPVLVLKKLSQTMVYVLPVTSKVKDVYYHKEISGGVSPQAVVINQGRAVDTRRFLRRVHILPKNEFMAVSDSFLLQYKYETRQKAGFSGPEGLNTSSVTDDKALSRKLSVPYYSQFLDLTDPFWMLRACGAASLKMVAEFEGAKVQDILSLCQEAKDRGGYDMENGWIHDYMVSKAKELGLDAYRREGLTDTKELVAHLDAGHPVIVSVEKRVLEQKRFHLLVLLGVEGLNGEEVFWYHEPESTNKEKGQYRKVDHKTFMDYWRGKAIFVRK